MIEFAMMNNGEQPPNATVYAEFLIQQFSLLGLTAYLGDPSTNGCPFDFGDFTYTQNSDPTKNFMLTVIHPEMQDSCIVISYRATLTLAEFFGASQVDNVYYGIFARDKDNNLSASIGKNTYYYSLYLYAWRISTSHAVALRLSEAAVVVIGKDIIGLIASSSHRFFFTHYHVPILLPDVTPDDPHYLAINKPIAEYGLAYITFSSNDIISSELVELLIQGTYYYPLYIEPNKFYCIY